MKFIQVIEQGGFTREHILGQAAVIEILQMIPGEHELDFRWFQSRRRRDAGSDIAGQWPGKPGPQDQTDNEGKSQHAFETHGRDNIG